jgi:hypothetical protein
MLSKEKTMICIICFCCILFDMNIGTCSTNVDTCSIYEETLWISLDVTPEQRKQIDEIIGEAGHDVKNIQKKSVITNMFDIMEYESLLNDRRSRVNDDIMQVLSVEQQNIFDSQLKKQRQSQNISTAGLLNLDFSEKQELLVIQSLMLSQKQVWSIVSDKSLSWEVRRKKLNNINIFANLTPLLTKTQLNALNLWGQSLKLLQRQQL